MKKTSSNPNSSLDRVRSWARTKAHGPSPLSSPRSSSRNNLPNTSTSRSTSQNELNTLPQTPKTARQSTNTSNNTTDVASTNSPPPAPPPQDDGQGTVIEPETEEEKESKKNVALRFWDTGKAIILSSYINWLLVFVPIGIAAKCAKLSPGIIFAMNAIAIIPLAGLLSHATESVAKRMGDTVGALMNVTFGNAVELIIL
jgi:Ca2+:H+ antiporter